MRCFSFGRWLLEAACVWAIASTALATDIRFAFRGEVLNVIDGIGALGGRVMTGDDFRGQYTFNSGVPDTAPPDIEGEVGLYHNARPPAGIKVDFDDFTFHSVQAMPSLDILVLNDFGFAGTDGYGLQSRDNHAVGVPNHALDVLTIDWLANSQTTEPFDDDHLPLIPPSLNILGGGRFTIHGECTACAGPMNFFTIEGTLTHLGFGTVVADATGDDKVTGADFTVWNDNFGAGPGATQSQGDFSGDGFVTGADFVIWADNFGYSLPTATIPEPSTAVLALVALAVAYCVRRRG